MRYTLNIQRFFLQYECYPRSEIRRRCRFFFLILPTDQLSREGATAQGPRGCTVIRHVTKRLRRHWPKTRIVWRGDSHYGRVEAMEWAEDHYADYIFGLAGNAALDALVAETAVNLRFHHAMSSKAKLRTYANFLYQAGSWKWPRKVVARLECSLQPGECCVRASCRNGHTAPRSAG